MKRTQKRQKQCRQIDLVEIHITITGASGTPSAGGLDVAFVDSVTDLGAGNYKINFKDRAQRAIVPVSALASTDGLYARVTASDETSITVLLKTFAGVATDGNLNLSCLYHEARALY
jgi:hypothetical protein